MTPLGIELMTSTLKHRTSFFFLSTQGLVITNKRSISFYVLRFFRVLAFKIMLKQSNDTENMIIYKIFINDYTKSVILLFIKKIYQCSFLEFKYFAGHWKRKQALSFKRS